MMSRSLRFGVLMVASLLVLAIGSHQPSVAQFRGGIGGMGGGFTGGLETRRPASPLPRVYVRMPFNEREVEVHRALERPIPMPFESDTPLNDVLEYIRQ